MIAPILSYDDINKRAEDFLREHKRNKIRKVPSKKLAHLDRGMRLPSPKRLRAGTDFGVQG